MDYFSILEISKKLGITKSKIYYKLRSDENFKLLFTKDLKSDSYVAHKDNIESIGKYFNIILEKFETDMKNNSIDDDILLKSKNDIITVLKEEIDVLKLQLAEKDSQISKLLQINQNNQVLLLEDSKIKSKSFWFRIRDFFK